MPETNLASAGPSLLVVESRGPVGSGPDPEEYA